MSESCNTSRRPWLMAGLALVILVTFGRLCVGEFVYWDDIANISENRWMQRPWPEIVGHYLTHAEAGLYIPVTYAAWGALARLGMTTVPNALGDVFNPWFFHSFNVLLHLLVSLLVFRLLRNVFKSASAAIFGAAAFALHPVQVETIGWVSGSKDLLCWFFVALGLNFYVDLIDQSRAGTTIRFWTRWRYWTVFLLMVIAFLSKPTAMVMSALLVVVDHFLCGTKLRIALLRALPFFAITAVGLFVTQRVQVAVGVYEPGLVGKLLVAGDALAHYAFKIVWPIDLTFDYGRMPNRVLSEWRSTTQFIWIIPAVIGIAALCCWKIRPALTGAAAIFLICVAPLLGFVPFMFQAYSTVADHYMYFALLGVAVAVTSVLSRIPLKRQWLVTPILLALALLSFRQCAVWHNTTSLTMHGIKVNPQSFGSYNNLGLDQANRREIESAIGSFTRAVEINPKFLIAFRNRGRTSAQYLGDYASAERDFERVLHLVRTSDPPAPTFELAGALLELARAQTRLGKLESASKLIDEAERIQPDHEDLRGTKIEWKNAVQQANSNPSSNRE